MTANPLYFNGSGRLCGPELANYRADEDGYLLIYQPSLDYERADPGWHALDIAPVLERILATMRERGYWPES